MSLEQIRNKISRLKLNKIDKFNINQFRNIKTKEISYILGLMWADGYMTNDNRHIIIRLINEDMKKLKNIFELVGINNYKIIDMIKYGNFKPIGQINMNNVKLGKLFYNYGFKEKSIISPNKLLKNIPGKLQHYFFRGLIDGDGCFYINKKYYTYQFILASTINQDWSYMVNLCNILGINYRIDKRDTLKSKSSAFRICRKKDVIKLGDYIYNDFTFGLNRKYQKFLKIKNS